MSFPQFPIDGQTSVVNNITWVYNQASNAWSKQYVANATLSSLTIVGNGTSTSTTTGALVVAGGVGIGGNLYANLIYSNGVPVGSSTFGGGTIIAATQITSATVSVSTTTGALVVRGGVGIGDSLYVNTAGYIAGAQIITTATIGQYAAGTGLSSTGSNQIFIVTTSTTSTNTLTGALVVVGGVGIGQNLNVGGTITGGSIRSTTSASPPSNPSVGDIWYNSSTDVMYRYTFDGTSYYWIDEYTTIVTGVSATTSKQLAFALLFGG
jgi:hypothetical protein